MAGRCSTSLQNRGFKERRLLGSTHLSPLEGPLEPLSPPLTISRHFWADTSGLRLTMSPGAPSTRVPLACRGPPARGNHRALTCGAGELTPSGRPEDGVEGKSLPFLRRSHRPGYPAALGQLTVPPSTGPPSFLSPPLWGYFPK